MTSDDILTAQRLLVRVAALLGADTMEVHAHGVNNDVIASILVAGGNVNQFRDGQHVATLESGRLEINAYSKQKEMSQ